MAKKNNKRDRAEQDHNVHLIQRDNLLGRRPMTIEDQVGQPAAPTETTFHIFTETGGMGGPYYSWTEVKAGSLEEAALNHFQEDDGDEPEYKDLNKYLLAYGCGSEKLESGLVLICDEIIHTVGRTKADAALTYCEMQVKHTD